MFRLTLLVAILSINAPLFAQSVNRYFTAEFLVTGCEDSAAYTGEIRWNGVKWQGIAYDSIGKKRMIGTYLDSAGNIPDGAFAYYYPNGKRMLIGSFVEGKMEGKWTEYLNSGTKNAERQFEHSIPVGAYTVWYANGNIMEQGEYINGYADEFTSYHRNGKIACVSHKDSSIYSKVCYDESGARTDCIWYSTPSPNEKWKEKYIYEKFNRKWYEEDWGLKDDELYLLFEADEFGNLSYVGIYRELWQETGYKYFSNRPRMTYKYIGKKEITNPGIVAHYKHILKMMSPWNPAYYKNIAVPHQTELTIHFD